MNELLMTEFNIQGESPSSFSCSFSGTYLFISPYLSVCLFVSRLSVCQIVPVCHANLCLSVCQFVPVCLSNCACLSTCACLHFSVLFYFTLYCDILHSLIYKKKRRSALHRPITTNQLYFTLLYFTLLYITLNLLQLNSILYSIL